MSVHATVVRTRRRFHGSPVRIVFCSVVGAVTQTGAPADLCGGRMASIRPDIIRQMMRYAAVGRVSQLYAIDPGLGGTGIARWIMWPEHKRPRLKSVAIIRDRARDDTLTNRCADLTNRLPDSPEQSDFVVIEMPQHMTNTKGIAAQAGAVYKLTFLVGFLAARFDMSGATVHVVNPSEWKGQLPKDIVQQRVERILGKSTCRELNIRSHAWDAVGIGLWALGRL